ncbi:MAG: hypothetical protein GOVbin4691_34 [Prokaryotic dsDNA virus sp.]|jgi:predicted transcriptional regulator|nr:MAG: hypothetical protein GOVbin4691_34 [Prokaryotic dsDNA virus sp.]|tara:strand:- start:239 stop:553 length:315 start_codon:yes stop_codon:yes gene_type:complete
MSKAIKIKDNEFMIPVKISAQKGLSGTDSIILGMIFTTIYKKQLFLLSNKTIAQYVGRTKSAVSKSLSKLKRLGHIKEIEYDSPIYSKARRIQMSNELYRECLK